MSLSRWNERSGCDSSHVTRPYYDTWREGAVEVRPFTAKTRLRVSEAQGLSSEAMKGNPLTTVIPGVDESKSSPRTNRRPDRTYPMVLVLLGYVTGSNEVESS